MKESLLHIGRATALASTLALSGCGDGADAPLLPPTVEVNTQPTINQAEVATQQYLSELNSQGILAREIGLPGLSVPTNIVNATEFELNAQAATNVYRFFEKLAVQETSVSSKKLPDGTTKPIVINSANSMKKRTMFLIDSKTNQPSWGENAGGYSLIHNNVATGYSSSETKIQELFTDEAEGISSTFLVESCQQAIITGLMDPRTKIFEPDIASQEYFCNSLSFALLAKMRNMTYKEYLDFKTKFAINLPNVGLAYAEPLGIPEEVYSIIPSNIRILK